MFLSLYTVLNVFVYVNGLYVCVLCLCVTVRRHPACCDCQGELALADRMGANLLVCLCVFLCMCFHEFTCTCDPKPAFLLQRVMALRGTDRQEDEVGEVKKLGQEEAILFQKFHANKTH